MAKMGFGGSHLRLDLPRSYLRTGEILPFGRSAVASQAVERWTACGLRRSAFL